MSQRRNLSLLDVAGKVEAVAETLQFADQLARSHFNAFSLTMRTFRNSGFASIHATLMR